MNWNEALIQYTNEHPESIIYGFAQGNDWGDNLSMVVPTQRGTVLFQMEVKPQGKVDSYKYLAMLKVNLNQPYELSVTKQNLLKMGADMIFKDNVKLADKQFNKMYRVGSNHPEYTKLVLSDLEWLDFMLQNKRLSIKVNPTKEGSEDHTIKVYYASSFMDALTIEEPVGSDEIDRMLRCLMHTQRVLSSYRIEDEAV